VKFAPRPENDFSEFIRQYYTTCRAGCSKIEAVAGKWMYRDLLPGMSDFDTRFILNDSITTDEWCNLSSLVGEVHLELASRYPLWWRNLEHPPGINLTWSEISSERLYYPEFALWTFYLSQEPLKMSNLVRHLSTRPWDVKNENFHLGRFCTYFGRYNRTIDPAVNLGVHANKYPLHSRIMHYFNPPVQSAICILDKHNYPGKMGAFELAAKYFPELDCWEQVFEILHAAYETPKWYEEANLTLLEDSLDMALKAIAAVLREEITLISREAGMDVHRWKRELGLVVQEPAAEMLEKTRFSRVFKGRLWFYLHAPEDYDTTFLIRNELGRVGWLFFTAPFRIYWRWKTGAQVENPLAILEELRGSPLTDGQVEATREFARLVLDGWQGKEIEVSHRILEIYDEFYRGLSIITADVLSAGQNGALETDSSINLIDS
jgi:hypothetical protein